MPRRKSEPTPEEAIRQVKKTRATGRAQYRAFTRLVNAHREEYDQYYTDELDKALIEAGLTK